MWNKDRQFYKSGLTFLESILTLGIFIVAIVGILEIFNQDMRMREKYTQRIIAAQLAHSLMSEIMVKDFGVGTLGSDQGEDRFCDPSCFDDVDDYLGYTESPPRDLQNNTMDGTAGMPDYSDFARSVDVLFVDELNVDSGGTATNYKRVVVTVASSKIPDVVLEEVKVNPIP